MTSRTGAETAMAALTIGKTVTVRKTVGETDVYLFAGISGDFSPNHVDEEYMKATQASTKMCASLPGTIVSYGYDRIRFPGAVFIGDTVTVTYEIAERDETARKSFAKVTVTNQRGDVVAVATHILKVVET